jgi:hypothetical protein
MTPARSERRIRAIPGLPWHHRPPAERHRRDRDRLPAVLARRAVHPRAQPAAVRRRGGDYRRPGRARDGGGRAIRPHRGPSCRRPGRRLDGPGPHGAPVRVGSCAARIRSWPTSRRSRPPTWPSATSGSSTIARMSSSRVCRSSRRGRARPILACSAGSACRRYGASDCLANPRRRARPTRASMPVPFRLHRRIQPEGASRAALTDERLADSPGIGHASRRASALGAQLIIAGRDAWRVTPLRRSM